MSSKSTLLRITALAALIASGCGAEPAPNKDMVSACRLLQGVENAFARYPGPDRGATGGDDAVALWRWEKTIFSSMGGFSDDESASDPRSYPGLHYWAYGRGAEKLKDKEFLRDLRHSYDAASEAFRARKGEMTLPQSSALLKERCGPERPQSEFTSDPNLVTFFDALKTWNQRQIEMYQLPPALLNSKLKETTNFTARSCGRYEKDGHFWVVCRDKQAETRLYVAEEGPTSS